MKKIRPVLHAVSLVIAAEACGSTPPTQLADLADLSLEQLTRITVTSASRREEPVVEVPASLFVITRDDIRRSGATSLPEALRLAPNLHVSRGDANQYAITARGFNNVLANKMLVLIDGRIVYTPLFSGVFWEAQDTLLDDIERIEVISGPSGTLWGANAVNGVISIITAKAEATQGILAMAGAGDDERVAGLRYGGTLPGAGHYRAYLKYIERDAKRAQATGGIGDDTERITGGFRADWSHALGQVTLLGDAYRGEVGKAPLREFSGANLTGRVVRQLGKDSALTVQAFYDRTERRHLNTFEETLDTFDVEMQHSSRPHADHVLVWGGGYRYSRDDVLNTATQAFIPPDRSLEWVNAFVQDEFQVLPRLYLIGGLKAERNPYTGNEWLPSIRVAWYPKADTMLWGAVSRAVRAPSRLDRELFIPGAPPFALAGSDRFRSEVALVAELGYRAQVTDVASYSATVFHHDYDRLRSIGLVDGRRSFTNDIEGRLTGVEAWASYRVLPTWRLSGGFVLQDFERRVKPGGRDLGGMASLGNDPKRTALLRSSWSPISAIDVDIALRHVGKLQVVVPSYTAVDARVAWRPSPRLELSLTAQNLLDGEHIEWQNRGIVDRSVFFRVTWRS